MEYKVPKIFHIHILYDVRFYPMFTVIYKQITSKDKRTAIVYRLFLFQSRSQFLNFGLNKKPDWLNGAMVGGGIILFIVFIWSRWLQEECI